MRSPSFALRTSVVCLTATLMMIGHIIAPSKSLANIPVVLRQISTASPVPAACTEPPDAETLTIRDSETQNSLALRPRHANQMAAVWTQDYDDATVLATTSDGWISFVEEAVPGMEPPCEGGGSSTNPRVSIGPDGTIYVTSNTNLENVVNVRRNGVWVTAPENRILPGGGGWPQILADPKRPGVAYATALHFDTAMDADPTQTVMTRGYENVYRTTDSGASWAKLGRIATPPDGKVFAFGRLMALPNGSLADVFLECAAHVGACTDGSAIVHLALSTDAGETWSVAPSSLVGPIEGWMDSAVDPNGDVLVAFVQPDDAGQWNIKLARWSNRGQSLSKPATVLSDAVRAFHVTLAVAGDGTVGILYEDNSSPPSLEVRAPRDVWFTFAPPHGTWAVTRFAGPTDESGAPPKAGHEQPLGEWEGLVGFRDGGFGGVVTLAKPQATIGRTDVFYGPVSP